MKIPIPRHLRIPNEKWRPLPPRYDQDYWISDQGRLWSCKVRKGQSGRFPKMEYQEMKYHHYEIYNRKLGYRPTVQIRFLVAEVFIPNPHQYRYLHHRDGDLLNCRATNLHWQPVRQTEEELAHLYNITIERMLERAKDAPTTDEELQRFFDSL